jgi:hypothetical protein
VRGFRTNHLPISFQPFCQVDVSFAFVALGKYGTSHALFSLGSNREDHLNPISFLAEQVLPRTCPVFVNGTMMGSLIPE